MHLVEKRKYKRANLKFSVEYRGKSYWQVLKAINVSAGGIFIVTDKVELPQTKVKIMFTFGKGKRRVIHTEGVVVWNRPYQKEKPKGQNIPSGMGIMFIKFLPPNSKDFINDLIEKKQAKD